MLNRNYLNTAWITIFFLTGLCVTDALAYLDPGTGSYILQILIGAFLGILYAVKLCWANIKIYVGGLFGQKKAAKKTDEDIVKDGRIPAETR